MLRKIILPVVLLIFTQQNFYGMNEGNLKILDTTTQKKQTEDINEQQYLFWRGVDDYMNKHELWLLWAILDNVPFQYGNSKI